MFETTFSIEMTIWISQSITNECFETKITGRSGVAGDPCTAIHSRWRVGAGRSSPLGSPRTEGRTEPGRRGGRIHRGTIPKTTLAWSSCSCSYLAYCSKGCIHREPRYSTSQVWTASRIAVVVAIPEKTQTEPWS